MGGRLALQAAAAQTPVPGQAREYLPSSAAGPLQPCCAQQAWPLTGGQHMQGHRCLAGHTVLTAWGNRVTSVRRMGREGSRYHLHTQRKGYSNFLAG